jgi:hypothetical protein
MLSIHHGVTSGGAPRRLLLGVGDRLAEDGVPDAPEHFLDSHDGLLFVIVAPRQAARNARFTRSAGERPPVVGPEVFCPNASPWYGKALGVGTCQTG